MTFSTKDIVIPENIIDYYKKTQENHKDRLTKHLRLIQRKLGKRGSGQNQMILDIDSPVLKFKEIPISLSNRLFRFYYKTDNEKEEYVYLRSLCISIFQTTLNAYGDYLKAAVATLRFLVEVEKPTTVDLYIEFIFFEKLQDVSHKLFVLLVNLTENPKYLDKDVEELIEMLDEHLVLNENVLRRFAFVNNDANTIFVKKDEGKEEMDEQTDLSRIQEIPLFNLLRMEHRHTINPVKLTSGNRRYDKGLLTDRLKNGPETLFHLLPKKPTIELPTKDYKLKSIEQKQIKLFNTRIRLSINARRVRKLEIFNYQLLNMILYFKQSRTLDDKNSDVDKNKNKELSTGDLFLNYHKLKPEFMENTITVAIPERSIKRKGNRMIYKSLNIRNIHPYFVPSIVRNFQLLKEYMPEMTANVRVHLDSVTIQMDKTKNMEQLYIFILEEILGGPYSGSTANMISLTRHLLKDYDLPFSMIMIYPGYLQVHLNKRYCEIEFENLHHKKFPDNYILEKSKPKIIQAIQLLMENEMILYRGEMEIQQLLQDIAIEIGKNIDDYIKRNE